MKVQEMLDALFEHGVKDNVRLDRQRKSLESVSSLSG